MYARLWKAPAAALLVLVTAACGDGPNEPPPPPPAVASLAVSPGERSLTAGETVELTATLKDASGKPVTGRTIQWASNNDAAATVSQAGVVTARAAGEATVTATSEGKKGSATITVTAVEEPPPPPPPVQSVTLDATTVSLEEGATRQLSATPKDASGAPLSGRDVEWTSNAETVARVSASGLVTAVREGTATITATVEGKSAQATVAVSLSIAYDLLFDRWSIGAGNIMQPELYHLDMRTPGAAPTFFMQTTYTPADVSLSPDGTKIAFVAVKGFGPNIYVANRDMTGMRRLTTSTGYDDQPAWSSDGTKIAYRRWAPGGPPGIHNRADIWVINADGTGAMNLTSDAGGDGSHQSPAWAPVGARIAYARETRGADGYMRSRILTMRPDGSDRQAVTADTPNYDDQSVWSPDGQTILFVRQGPEHVGDLRLVSAAGGNERPLMAADPAGAQRTPAWSPDGKLIAFTSSHEIIGNRAGDYQVYTVRPDGTGLVRRTSDVGDKGNPAWIRRLP